MKNRTLVEIYHLFRTLQNALNGLIDYTIQESEFHHNYAESLKTSVLPQINEMRVKLRFLIIVLTF